MEFPGSAQLTIYKPGNYINIFITYINIAYILPSEGLYATYHLLPEPGNNY